VIGGNLLLASGRPRSCLGTNPLASLLAELPVGIALLLRRDRFETNVPSPRGSLGRLPWEKTLDLNLVYRRSSSPACRCVDVFNVFNSQTAQKVYERYNTNQRVTTVRNADLLHRTAFGSSPPSTTTSSSNRTCSACGLPWPQLKSRRFGVGFFMCAPA
jgi:hypothetical protein